MQIIFYRRINMLKSIRKSRQSGFTLVELGIVLALIGIGLFFAISKMQETGDASRAQNTASDISVVVQNVQRYYATAATFPDPFVPADLIANRVVPVKWADGAALVGPFGGVPALTRQAGLAGEANITIPNVPTRVCSEMARIMADGFREIAVAGVVVKPVNGVLDLNALGTQCTGGTVGSVEMRFRFQKA
ncbi:MAG: prepilin-type N-terminal cleavage/methylation domain-containing protein [Burkholderiales bacterium]|nr:prepilin-type N-terminal cleavage/methylation domain-containing protein [Burkholderiales bacterium]MCA3157571.1 prepilin-type N-terminal cleavage/methylation domain-containing protein [Burkholderiales bacterium]